MNPRESKKEPPDPLFSPFDLSIASSSIVDLAMSLHNPRVPFPAIPFPCLFLGLALSSVSSFYQIGSPPQPVVGVQSMTRRFRSRTFLATILGNYWVQDVSGCVGLPGSTRGISSGPLLVLSIHFRGPRSVMFERNCPGWQVRSIVCGCDGLAGSPGGRSAFTVGQILQAGGLRPTIGSRFCQAWRICSHSTVMCLDCAPRHLDGIEGCLY
uniref:Uncharacterized protein n=1 Tax=Opuntia streptacantha TaxID=393608 RepID=A0A7C8YR93_OPUST